MADTIVTNPNMILPTNKLFKNWAYGEIFVPGGAGGLYVPNKDDEVTQWTKDYVNKYQVVDVDFTTGKSQLELRYSMPREAVEDGRDIILSTSPGRPSSQFRALVDQSVRPPTITIEQRMVVLGTMAKNVRIFKGGDQGPNAQVISAMYDQSNNLIGELIPLEEVATFDLPNAGLQQGKSTAVKRVSTGYTVTELQDNELLTLVAYSDDGSVILSEPLVVFNTGHARRPDAYRKFVTTISLDSPYIEDGNDNVIRIPYNMPLDSVFGMGVVNYSDGGRATKAVDGTTFKLHGLNERRVATSRADLKIPLTLTYLPSKEEFYYGETVGEYRHISRKYWLITGPAEAPFSIKLFGFPEWMGPLAGYRMRWFMTNLVRKKVTEVTNWIRYGINSPLFDGLAYGVAQHLTVTLDLSQVDNYYAPGTRYIQPVVVGLREDGTNPGTAWTVTNDPDGKLFGEALKVLGDFVQADRYELNISMGAGSVADWVNKLFYAAGPIKNPEVESYTPEPTHFNIIVGNLKAEYPTSFYNQKVVLPDVVEPGRLILFEWIRRTGNGDMMLGVSAVSYLQVD